MDANNNQETGRLNTEVLSEKKTIQEIAREKIKMKKEREQQQKLSEDEEYRKQIAPFIESKETLNNLSNEWQESLRITKESGKKSKELFDPIFSAYKDLQNAGVLEEENIKTLEEFILNDEYSKGEGVKEYIDARKKYKKDFQDFRNKREKLKDNLGIGGNIKNEDLKNQAAEKLGEINQIIEKMEFNSPKNTRERKEAAEESFRQIIEENFKNRKIDGYVESILGLDEINGERHSRGFENFRNQRLFSDALIDGRSELSLEDRKKIFLDVSLGKLDESIRKSEAELQKFKEEIKNDNYSNLKSTWTLDRPVLKAMVDKDIETFDKRKKLAKELFILKTEVEFSVLEQRNFENDPKTKEAKTKVSEIDKANEKISVLERNDLAGLGMDQTKDFQIRKDYENENNFSFNFYGQNEEWNKRSVDTLKKKEALRLGPNEILNDRKNSLSYELQRINGQKKHFMENEENFKLRIQNESAPIIQRIREVSDLMNEEINNRRYMNDFKKNQVEVSLKELLTSLDFGKNIIEQGQSVVDTNLEQLISLAKTYFDKDKQMTQEEKNIVKKSDQLEEIVNTNKKKVRDLRYAA